MFYLACHTFAAMMLTLGADLYLYNTEATWSCRCENDTGVRPHHQSEER